MTTTSGTPRTATIADVRRAIARAKEQERFLSVYVNCDANEVLDGSIATRLRSLLDNVPDDVESSDVRDTFRRLRERVERFIEELRPGAPAIALFADGSDGWDALWLPEPIKEQARFRQGAHVMPLVYLLDEWEPFGVAFVEKDKAMLLVSGLARTEEERRLSADVPGRHDEGGWSQARYERHTLEHVDRHLKEVRDELVALHHEHRFRRLFLAGPTEALTRFKGMLPKHLSDIAESVVSLPSYTSAEDAIERVRPSAKEAERAEELRLVEEAITRAEKGAGAVTGSDAALRAVNRHNALQLLMNRDSDAEGWVCEGSGVLVGLADEAQPECVDPKHRVRLADELPLYAMRAGVSLEIVQGQAAERLSGYGGLAALLKSA